MVKSSTQLLRSMMRVGRMQQRSASKLVEDLFGLSRVPARKPKVRSKTKPKPVSKSVPKAAGAAGLRADAGRPATRSARASATGSHAEPLPGKWLASRYLAAPQSGNVAGSSMRYWLYLPAKAPTVAIRRSGYPLVVMLHGCEQTATQFAQGTRMNRLAEQKGFAVLYPQQSMAAHSHRCWKWYERATQAGGGDVELIVGIINTVRAAYPIDRSRIYIGGISAGAGMANIVAFNHPELIAAVGMHSGPVFGAGHSPMGALGVMQHGASHRTEGAIAEVLAGRAVFPRMPTILIQGEGDRVVRPINQTHLMRQSLLLNRMPSDTTVSVEHKPARHAGAGNPINAHQIRDFYVDDQLLLRVAQIAELDHAWSGGDASLSFNSHAGPDASKMMLDFFARHRRVAGRP